MKALRPHPPTARRAPGRCRLQTRMFLLFGGISSSILLLLTLVKLFGLPVYGVTGVYQDQLRQAEQTIELITASKERQLKSWLAERCFEIGLFAQHQLEIKDFQARSPTADISERLEAHLRGHVETSPAFATVWFHDLVTGRTFASSGQSSQDPQVLEAFVRRLLQSPDGYLVDILHSPGHRHCQVVFGQTVTPPGASSPIGALIAAAAKGTFILPWLHDIRGLGETGEVVLLDSLSHPLAPLKHPESADAAPNLPASYWTLGGEGVPRGEDQAISAQDYRGRQVLQAGRHIEVGGGAVWTLLVKQDRAEILRGLLPNLLAVGCVGLLGMALLLVAVYYAARSITRPLQTLIATAEAVREGDFSARADLSSEDEISLLAEVFNRMLDQVANWQQQLEQAVADTTEELNLAYQELHGKERQQAAIVEISTAYLQQGEVDEALDLLMERARWSLGALGGCFLHCVVTEGGAQITAVSKLCKDRHRDGMFTAQAEAAFLAYAEALQQSAGRVLPQVVAADRTLTLTAEEYLAARDVPMPDGLPAIESMILTPVSVAGTMFGVIALVNRPGGFGPKEISNLEVFAAEAALLIHADARERARSAAEETTRLRSAFLANMSHELRTPLNVIIGMNQLLQKLNNSRLQQDYLEKVGFSAKQLLALINDILDLSKLGAGRELVIEKTVFDPEALFYTIAQALACGTSNREVELHVDIRHRLPAGLIGDARRLTQIVNNLLSNAIKFTPRGNVMLMVFASRSGERLVLDIHVMDTGIGMTVAEQEQIFQPFVQVDSSLTRQHGGSGLGLAISRKLCQLLGSDLSVSSLPGEGSTFRCKIPFEIAPAPTPQEMPLALPEELQGLPVLIAHACPVCLDILERMLSAMAFRPQLTRSAQEASAQLQTAAAQGRPYRLLLVGQSLADISGVEFVEQLAREDWPDLRQLLLVHALDLWDLSKRLAPLGLAGLLSSPVRPRDLLNTLRSAFSQSAFASEAVAPRRYGWTEVRVLLVEDNPVARQMMRAMLEAVGIEVVEAKNGKEAVAQVATEAFDLVLMDIQMPEMDGLTATRMMRQLPRPGIEKLPIIALTAHAFVESQEQSLAAGMNAHLTKPIEQETLYAALRRWLPAEKEQADLQVEATTAEAVWTDLARALPNVDVKAGLRRAVGNREFYLGLLRKFAAEFSGLETELGRELAAGLLDGALLRLHTLKGTAGSLGAYRLQQLAGQLEQQLKTQGAGVDLQGLSAELDPLLDAIATLPEAPSPAATDPCSLGTSAELHSLLTQLREPLKMLQVQEIRSLAERLSARVWPDAEGVTQLLQQIEKYQFGPAAERVEALIEAGER